MTELLLPLTLDAWLILIGLAAFVWIGWHSVKNNLYWITLLLPTFLIRFTILGIPSTFLEVLIWLTFVIWLIKGQNYRRINFTLNKQSTNRIPYGYRIAISGLLLASIIGVLFSTDITAALGLWKAYFIDPLLFFILVIYTTEKREDLYRYVDGLGLLLVILFVIGLFQKMTGLTIPHEFWAAYESRRITTILGYPNANGLLVAPIVGLYISYMKVAQSMQRTLFKICVIGAGILIILWAQSLGALLAILGAILLSLVYIKKTRSLALAIIVLSIMVPLNIPALKYGFIERFEKIKTQQLDLDSTSLEIRINQWSETWHLLASSPRYFILGTGLVGYQEALRPFHRNDFLEIFLYPHLLFLNFWTTLGLLGLVSFVYIFVLAVKDCFRSLRNKQSNPLALGLLFAWIIMLIHGLVDVPYLKNDLAVLFWLLIALTILLLSLGNKSRIDTI